MNNIHPTSSSRRPVTNLFAGGRRLPGISRWLSVALLVLLWATSGLAIPFSDYRDHVKKAINSLDRLTQTGEGQTQAQRAEFISANIRSVAEALPRSERVEWQGTSFETDNSWLHDDLKELAGMPLADPNRVRSLDRIRERLQALQERLEETSKGEGTGAVSKDEMQGRLAGILQRSEYASEVKQKPALERLMKWLLELLNKLLPRNRQLSPGGSSSITRVAEIFIASLAVAVIAYCIWLAAPRLLSRRRRPKKKKKPEARVVLGERLEPDQSGADLLAEADALARAGELRAAIRKGYIALLVELGDRKLISLAQYKTNRDYLRSVREIEKLHGNMLQLTSSFELHWYGLVQASESDWTEFRAFYREALRG